MSSDVLNNILSILIKLEFIEESKSPTPSTDTQLPALCIDIELHSTFTKPLTETFRSEQIMIEFKSIVSGFATKRGI
jgi:hypothetical protein